MGDVDGIRALIEASVRGLSEGYYTAAQIEWSVGTVLGLDTQLILDGTYFVVEAGGGAGLAASGGWSFRRTLCGGDGAPNREDSRVYPGSEAAKIRAIFVHPDLARRGLGSAVLAYVEAAAEEAGFRRFEMGSTLPGQPLYRLRGYVEEETFLIPLGNGEALPVVRMVKDAGSA